MVLFFDSEYVYAKNEQIKCIAQHFHPFVLWGKEKFTAKFTLDLITSQLSPTLAFGYTTLIGQLEATSPFS